MPRRPEPLRDDGWSHCLGTLDAAWFARERLGWTPDPQQTHLLERRWRRCLLNCFRQWGKSSVTAVKAVHQAWHFPNSLTLVVSPTGRQSGEFVHKASRFLSRLGVTPRGDGRNEISLLLPNGSRIVGLPANEGTIRGFSAASLLVIDEAAWVPDPIYHAVRPMLAPGTGELWVMSTPNGQQGFFWEAWEFGEGWERVEAKASESSRISPSELAEHRRALGEAKYLQEYQCEFTQREGGIVSRHIVQRMLHPSVKPLQGDPWGPFCPVVDGPRLNVAGHPELLIGVDLGQKQDYTAIAVIERYREIGVDRDPITHAFPITRRSDLRHLERIPLGTEWAVIVRRIASLSRAAAQRGLVTIAVDATGIGSPVIEMLRCEPLGGRLMPVVITSGEKPTRDGSTHRIPRKDLLDGLVLQLENGELRVAAEISDAPLLVRELLNLKRTIHSAGDAIGSWQSKEHDDLVFAAALACWWARS